LLTGYPPFFLTAAFGICRCGLSGRKAPSFWWFPPQSLFFFLSLERPREAPLNRLVAFLTRPPCLWSGDTPGEGRKKTLLFFFFSRTTEAFSDSPSIGATLSDNRAVLHRCFFFSCEVPFSLFLNALRHRRFVLQGEYFSLLFSPRNNGLPSWILLFHVCAFSSFPYLLGILPQLGELLVLRLTSFSPSSRAFFGGIRLLRGGVFFSAEDQGPPLFLPPG